MKYAIVNAQQRHLDDLAQLEQVCFSCPWTREQLAMELPDGRHEFLVAENEDGNAIGYVGMMHVLDEGYISNVAVAAAYRQQGIGTALLEEMVRRAEGLGLSFATLEVRESNQTAISLYKKHGFAQVGRRRNYYEHPREDAILMTKLIK